MTDTHVADASDFESEHACRTVLLAFAHHLDHRRFEEAAALFAEDGVWDRHGDKLVGPAQILAVIAQRPETTVERHVTTTSLFTRKSPTEYAAVSYVLIYRREAGDKASTGVVGPAVIGDFHDEFRLTDDGWRISNREAVAAFRAQ